MKYVGAHVRIAVLGGGPGGLLAALLAKRSDPAREITVFERNRAGGTFAAAASPPARPPPTANSPPGRP